MVLEVARMSVNLTGSSPDALLRQVRECLEQKRELSTNPEIVANASTLTRLDLSSIALSREQLIECTRLFTALTDLRLSRCDLNDQACKPLSDVRLLSLDLSHNPQLEGSFVNHLPTSLTRLTALSLKIPIQVHNRIWERLPQLNLIA